MKISLLKFHEAVMHIESFKTAVDNWIKTIHQYSFKQLCTQPDINSWSISQVCVHLINDTNWFIEQIKICLSNDANADEAMSPFAQTIFIKNSFPDEKLTNPANTNMPQPVSKDQLLNAFIKIKNDMNDVAQKISSNVKGKTKHPGLGYFNATEWLQFAVMHLQHHVKQKQRIEEFLRRSI